MAKVSEEWRLKGNKCFSEGKFEEAIKCYTEAIGANSTNAVLFSNRAMANIKLQRFFEAENDCSKALELNKSLDKAYYRRGLSRKELHLYKSAFSDFKKALELSPHDENVKKEIDSLKVLLNTTSKLRILPVSKVNQLQSKAPMKKITIQNVSTDSKNVDIDLADNIKKLVFSRNPKNHNEFEFDWRQLSVLGIEHKLAYLEAISLPALEHIFKFPFEPKILLEVLQTLAQSKNQMFVFNVLRLITKMPRFSLSVSFFDKEEFQALGIIFQNMSGEVNNAQVIEMAKKFNVKLN